MVIAGVIGVVAYAVAFMWAAYEGLAYVLPQEWIAIVTFLILLLWLRWPLVFAIMAAIGAHYAWHWGGIWSLVLAFPAAILGFTAAAAGGIIALITLAIMKIWGLRFITTNRRK